METRNIKFDNINIVKSNKPSDINNFLNQYSFDEVDSAGDVNDEWYSILGDKWKKTLTEIMILILKICKLLFLD